MPDKGSEQKHGDRWSDTYRCHKVCNTCANKEWMWCVATTRVFDPVCGEREILRAEEPNTLKDISTRQCKGDWWEPTAGLRIKHWIRRIRNASPDSILFDTAVAILGVLLITLVLQTLYKPVEQDKSGNQRIEQSADRQ